MKELKINKLVSICNECIYCEYDPYYDGAGDSGYNCNNINRRIIDDWLWDNTNNPDRLIKTHTGIPTPKWCPLPDKI